MARDKIRGWSDFIYSADIKGKEHLRGPIGNGRAWVNHLYVVQERVFEDPTFGTVHHLWIRNNDGSTFHDFSEFQRIKNEIVGKEWTGVEIYPSQSELVDDANIYHLWCFDPKKHRLPFTILKKTAKPIFDDPRNQK